VREIEVDKLDEESVEIMLHLEKSFLKEFLKSKPNYVEMENKISDLTGDSSSKKMHHVVALNYFEEEYKTPLKTFVDKFKTFLCFENKHSLSGAKSMRSMLPGDYRHPLVMELAFSHQDPSQLYEFQKETCSFLPLDEEDFKLRKEERRESLQRKLNAEKLNSPLKKSGYKTDNDRRANNDGPARSTRHQKRAMKERSEDEVSQNDFNEDFSGLHGAISFSRDPEYSQRKKPKMTKSSTVYKNQKQIGNKKGFQSEYEQSDNEEEGQPQRIQTRRTGNFKGQEEEESIVASKSKKRKVIDSSSEEELKLKLKSVKKPQGKKSGKRKPKEESEEEEEEDLDRNLTVAEINKKVGRYQFKSTAQNEYDKAIEKLQLSDIPDKFPCRDKEVTQITEYLLSGLENRGSSSSLYISGMPGTGKTATTLETINNLLRSGKNSFEFVKINAMSLVNPMLVYTIISEKLT